MRINLVHIKGSLLLLIVYHLCCQTIQGQQDYGYDQNGNLISDQNKNITSVKYNVLNLPEEIVFDDGRKIINTYTANGKKIGQKTILSDGAIQLKKEYIKDIIYASENLEYILTAAGYIEPDSGNFLYAYQIKDQLKNIRLSFSDSNRDGYIDIAQEIKEEKNYYPFGLQMQLPNNIIRGRKHPYGFAGKEEIETFDLDWNDFGARMYDSALARWHVIDPLAEKYEDLSSYAYVANNPIAFYDPDGKQIAKASLKEWKQQKKEVIAKRDQLKLTLGKAKPTKANKKYRTQLQQRITSLNNTKNNLGVLEKSSQMYRLDKIGGNVGKTHYDKHTKEVVIDYTGTDTFVHETTHAGQFETGDIFFIENTGKVGIPDLHDEVAAYKAQYAYSPKGFTTTYKGITPNWVKNLTVGGKKPYKDFKTIPITINSSKTTIESLFPGNPLKGYPEKEPLKTMTDIIYKK